ncbi:hypothetical protein MRB53_041915 [Persea americana]|nr:hypothetical protein MRB53_041915 [Persea americana]
MLVEARRILGCFLHHVMSCRATTDTLRAVNAEPVFLQYRDTLCWSNLSVELNERFIVCSTRVPFAIHTVRSLGSSTVSRGGHNGNIR